MATHYPAVALAEILRSVNSFVLRAPLFTKSLGLVAAEKLCIE